MDFEIKIIEFLQSGRSPFFDVSFQVISQLGSIVGIVFLCLVLLICNRKLCFWYLFSYGFAALFVKVVKGLVARVRPYNFSDVIVAIDGTSQDYSFPSGHAACATAIAIFLAYFLFKYFKPRPARAGIVVCSAIYVALVCLSRMYLGKHYLTDVLVGVAISAVVCTAGIFFMRYCHKKKERQKNEG